MIIEIDASVAPPATTLVEPDDFKALSVRVVGGSHVWLEPDWIAALAGDRATPEWTEQLTAMCQYAESKGWTDATGRLRAHVVGVSEALA